MKNGIEIKEITLIIEIWDSKLNKFHTLKVTSNAQKTNTTGFKKRKFDYRNCNIKKVTLRKTLK